MNEFERRFRATKLEFSGNDILLMDDEMMKLSGELAMAALQTAGRLPRADAALQNAIKHCRELERLISSHLDNIESKVREVA